QNQEYKRSLQELIEIARENDHLNHLMHELTLGILEAPNLELLVETVQQALHCDFEIDVVVFKLFDNAIDSEKANSVDVDTDLQAILAEILFDEKPLCGQLDSDSISAVFKEQANGIESTALIPLSNKGILALGSFDENRFRANMGAVFLSQLSELITRALDRFPEEQAT
ncbi:MAG TPA: hypothetical protein DCZ03_08715, partial [Gammaproteobacteria bacterium]|nr:hypothetical protein [Gammaproteobacteria bacterium]